MRGKTSVLFFPLLLALAIFSRAQDTAPSKKPFPPGFNKIDPDTTIVPNGVSPDGQWALAFEPGHIYGNGASMEGNYLVARSAPEKLIPIYMTEPYGSFSAERGGLADSIVRWSPNSRAFVVFKDNTRTDFPRSAYSICVVPIEHGQPGKPIDMLIEMLKVVDSGLVDAHAEDIAKTSYFYGSINDDELDDNLTFNSSGQLIVDCSCTTECRDDPTYKPVTARIMGLWDPAQKKFVKLDRTFTPPASGEPEKPSANADAPGPKIEIVQETKPGSGQYEVVGGVPVFPADSGIGHGEPMGVKNPKGVYLNLTTGLQISKAGTMHAIIGGPAGHLEGDLVETAPNSGVFSDDKKSATVSLPAGTILPTESKECIPATVDCPTVGLRGVRISLKNNAKLLYAPLDAASLKFDKAYDAGQINSAHATLRVLLPSSDGWGSMPQNESFDLKETAAGSGTFTSTVGKWTVTLNHITPATADGVGRIEATFADPGPGPTPLLGTLTQVRRNSLEFTQDATLGITPEYNQGTDLPVDNPEVTGDGVFYLRVQGASGPVNLVAKTDVSMVCLTAKPVPGQPGVAMTGKLIAVWHDATANTHYHTITTLYLSVGNQTTQFLLADDPSAKASPLDRLINQGAFKYNQGDMDAAIASFSEALKLDPKSALAFAGRGAAYAGKQDYAKALADMDRGVALAPRQTELLLNRGIIRDHQGDHDGAIADFTRVLELDPTVAQAFSERGKAREGKADKTGAMADFDHAIKLNPKLVDAHFQRGILKQDAGDLDGALVDYNKALLVDPQFPAAYFNRGVIREAKGNFYDAIADFRQFIIYAPNDANADYAELFLFLARAGENDEAHGRQVLSDALGKGWNAKPEDWVSKNAAFLLDRLSEADYLAAATAADPALDRGQHCEAWFYAGMKKLDAGDNAAAIDRFQKCLATGRADYMEYALAHAQLQALGVVK